MTFQWHQIIQPPTIQHLLIRFLEINAFAAVTFNSYQSHRRIHIIREFVYLRLQAPNHQGMPSAAHYKNHHPSITFPSNITAAIAPKYRGMPGAAHYKKHHPSITFPSNVTAGIHTKQFIVWVKKRKTGKKICVTCKWQTFKNFTHILCLIFWCLHSLRVFPLCHVLHRRKKAWWGHGEVFDEDAKREHK